MKLLKYLLPLFFVVTVGQAYAQSFNQNQEVLREDDDKQSLTRPFIEAQRTIPLGEKENKLFISGDVRVVYRYISEDLNGEQQRQRSTTTHPEVKYLYRAKFAPDVYKVEFNLIADYETDCTWASSKVEFENDLGKVTGSVGNLRLERAYIGYMFYDCNDTQLYVEVGREAMDDHFESSLEFGSRLDGGFIYYGTLLPYVNKFHMQAAVNIMDTTRREYAFAYEIGADDINCTGWFAKWSLAYWGGVDVQPGMPVPDTNFFVEPGPHQGFLTQQLLVGYKWYKPDGKLFAKFYGAYLANLIPIRSSFTNRRPENQGFYIGFEYGKVYKRGDWAWKVEVQYAEAQCYLESDNNGIGWGNVNGYQLYDTVDPILGIQNRRKLGNLNFWGPLFEFAYAFTDHITGRFQAMHSAEIRKSIGGTRDFDKVELRLVYSF